MTQPYLIQIDLEHKPCLVVGGGPIALHKTRHLVASGARVTVVSSSFHEGFDALTLERRCSRKFEDADIEGVVLVHAATNVPEVNEHIVALCTSRGVPCCAAHDGSLGSFSVPAMLDHGDLRVSIGTNGKSPSYGARLRRRIEAELPDCLDEYLNFLGESREISKQRISDGKLRMRFNAYLASAEGQAWFESTDAPSRDTARDRLVDDPESISDDYTPTWS
jgi:siroheme synthase-like protein